ncbi:hypothetical protein LMH87_000146 [Akanthomyces muscarius]|uniref:Uncharacterized protein n=1 Tax=Akanthomyces muscarius TaxID=2231603 RepID=A0A9W8QDZ4_AKAMU|nr:hypothetical protein LMH87_000146 [Akanthomyces muscarius]KAJ4154872.1 hypothetical protein LMH87_000146 [Akanthomyces muscarius]
MLLTLVARRMPAHPAIGPRPRQTVMHTSWPCIVYPRLIRQHCRFRDDKASDSSCVTAITLARHSIFCKANYCERENGG